MLSFKPNKSKGVLFASATALLWSIEAITLKIASAFADSITIVWARFLIAFVTLGLFVFLRSPQKVYKLKNMPFWVIISAALLGANHLGFMKGLALTTPANAGIIIQAAPILLIIMSFVFLKEKISKLQGLGFAIAMVGLLFFYQDQMQNFSLEQKNYQKGILWLFLGAITWAFFAIMQKQLVKKHNPSMLNIVIYGTCVLLFLFSAENTLFLRLSWPKLILIIYLGLTTVFSYGCLSLALKHLEASKISMILILNPILTIILMLLIEYFSLGWVEAEHFTFKGYIGAILIIAGALIVVGKNNKVINKR